MGMSSRMGVFQTPSGYGLRYLWEGNGTPVLFLHGFTGTHESFATSVASLSATFSCVAVDMIGHGKSDAPPEVEKYRMESVVEDLYALMVTLEFPHFSCVGYSMGGRTALALAVAHPEAVSRLVLESASPGIVDERDRHKRRQSDERLASEIETLGIASFVKRWEQNPLFSTQSTDIVVQERSIRLSQRGHGLARSLRGMGTGAQEELWTSLEQLRMPVLLITGGLDEKFTSINKAMDQKIHDSRHVVFANKGHNVHAESPISYNKVLSDFLCDNG